jgi:hypothetical protein
MWGLCCLGLLFLLDREVRIPAAEYRPELVVERLDPHLEQQMGRVFRPLHLLLLAEAVADHLVHGGFDKAGADPLSSAVALTIVGNEANGIKLSSNTPLINKLRASHGD